MSDPPTEHPRKVIMTGMYDPMARSDSGLLRRNIDMGEQFWTDEKRKLAKNLWEGISNEMSSRFGITPLEYQENIIRVVEVGEDTGEMIPHSGQINLDYKRISTSREFAHALAHEMGHFYAKRQILAKNADTNLGATMQCGLSFAFESPYPGQGKPIKQPMRAFSLFDEALNETVMTEILNKVSGNVPGLEVQQFPVSAYKNSIKMLDALFDSIVIAYNDPTLRVSENEASNLYPENYHAVSDQRRNDLMATVAKKFNWTDKITKDDVRDLFMTTAWGKPGTEPRLSYVSRIIEQVYGNGAFMHIANLTTRVEPYFGSFDRNPYSHNPHLKLWYIINLPQHPEIKRAFELPEQHVLDYQISPNKNCNIDLADLPPTVPYTSYTTEDEENKRGAKEIFDRFYDELKNADSSKSEKLLSASPFSKARYPESMIDQGILAVIDEGDPYNASRTRTYSQCLKLFIKQLGISEVPYKTEERTDDTNYSFERHAKLLYFHVPEVPGVDLVCINETIPDMNREGFMYFFAPSNTT